MFGNAETRSLSNTPEMWSERAKLDDHLDAVMWTAQGQAERHRAVLEALDPKPNETFLDFGCGTGELSERLFAPSYTGYDWSFQMACRAQERHPGFEFISTLPWRHFDVIACIGTFNLPGSLVGTFKTLDNLWVRCHSRMAVSLYSGDDERCLSYSPYDIIPWAEKHVTRYRLERIRHNDLLLVMWR